MSDPESVIDAVRSWTKSFVIELDLCPFARRVFEGDRIRYVVTQAFEAETLRNALAAELTFLAAAPVEAVETTMLIHPRALERFADYCDFLPVADQLVKTRGFRGVIQIASFHPQFQFANTEPDAVENYTNRSPYPLLHLLREDSLTKVIGDGNDTLAIPQRNADTLRRLGREKILDRLKTIASE